MSFRKFRLALAPVLLLTGGLLFVTNASANIMGGLITGSTGTVTVSLSSVFFNIDPAATGGGNSDVATGTNLSFAGCASGVLGSPGCLSVQEGITINNADLTLVAPSLANQNTFLTFASHPNLVFAMVWPPPAGSANTNCATASSTGMSCSVFAGSPIVLTYIGGDTEVSLQVASPSSPDKVSDTGVAGLATTQSTWSGGFTDFLASPLPNSTAPTPLDIQNYLCSGAPSVSGGGNTCTPADFASGKSVTSGQTGNFNAVFNPTPESSSAVLGSLGLAMLLAGARLRKYYGPGRWRKLKGTTRVRLEDATVRLAEVHWYEAYGIGKKELKIKRFLD